MKHSDTQVERITDAQMILNTVYTHLIKQGGPAMNDGLCRYRAPDGKMCAVGFMIPDAAYENDMESLNANSLIRLYAKDLAHLLPHMDLLRKMQVIHDSFAVHGNHGETWKQYITHEFKLLAQHNGLQEPA